MAISRLYITLRLLSQIDEDHKETTIDFVNLEPGDIAASKILTEEDVTAEEGRGNNSFISHADLQLKYLKNDCIQLSAAKYIKFEH